MHLSPEDIAAAEACGINFQPASDAQVQRMAMQRKVFYRAGEPILATRGDGFFETVGTLRQLIEEGRRQRRDPAQWKPTSRDEAPAAGPAPKAPPAEAMAEAPAPSLPEASSLPAEAVAEPVVPTVVPEPAPDAAPGNMPPKRQRRRRPVVTELAIPAEPLEPGPADLEALPGSVDRAAPRDRGQRWLVAGAARRGRANKHWSTRQRG